VQENGSHAMANIAPYRRLDAIFLGYIACMRNAVPPHTVDRIDRAIVMRLQAEGRIANVDLAESVSLSPSACLRRVKALEASGIIAGYRAELDRNRAGLGLTAFIELQVEGHSLETAMTISETLTAIPAVVACYLVSGSADFFVEVAVPDFASYEDLLLSKILAIPSVTSARSSFAIRTYLSRGPLPLDHWH
jgi:Lrp/AsnC family transcriptional regulator, leucine-responsive regulatory protein